VWRAVRSKIWVQSLIRYTEQQPAEFLTFEQKSARPAAGKNHFTHAGVF
jgi:hypothetical protein